MKTLEQSVAPGRVRPVLKLLFLAVALLPGLAGWLGRSPDTADKPGMADKPDTGKLDLRVEVRVSVGTPDVSTE